MEDIKIMMSPNRKQTFLFYCLIAMLYKVVPTLELVDEIMMYYQTKESQLDEQ